VSRDSFHQPRVLRAPSNLALSTAREGAATAPLGSLGQGLTTLMGKNFFLLSHLNLPSFSLQPFPLVLSLHPLVQSPSPSFLSAPPGTGSCSKVTLEPSLLQAEQPQLPQPVLVGEVLQPSDHLTYTNTSVEAPHSRSGLSGSRAFCPVLPQGRVVAHGTRAMHARCLFSLQAQSLQIHCLVSG